jgi:hypothetical protein
MKLTPAIKAHIDSLPYDRLLSQWRFARVGDPWFQDETGKYWGERMALLRPANASGAVLTRLIDRRANETDIRK